MNTNVILINHILHLQRYARFRDKSTSNELKGEYNPVGFLKDMFLATPNLKLGGGF